MEIWSIVFRGPWRGINYIHAHTHTHTHTHTRNTGRQMTDDREIDVRGRETDRQTEREAERQKKRDGSYGEGFQGRLIGEDFKSGTK